MTLILVTAIIPLAYLLRNHPTATSTTHPTVQDLAAPQLNSAFQESSARFAVPAPLLAAICYLEGDMTMHDGAPSGDYGFGCMHLAHNPSFDTLDAAARALGVSAQQVRTNMNTNIAGGAAVLRDDAISLSPTHTEPTTIGDWYGAIAMYGHAASMGAATMYADAVYGLLTQGYQTTLSNGEDFTQDPLQININTKTASLLAFTFTMPAGCKYDSLEVDYPHAIDCVLNPQTYDCNLTAPGSSCTYNDANRPTGLAINDIVIHDIEGTALNALNWFHNVNSDVSAHYIVDTNGLVYQVVREKDIAYDAGNWWYNEHSIGIEHAGYDATGYAWYNATEYLASARLVAYLLKKYHIPLDHSHIVSHGTIPSPTLATSPNHVDPGPYWLWEYYFYLIHLQGVPIPGMTKHYNVVTLHPATDKKPWGSYGHESKYNFNFFKLYQYPSTRSHLIPYMGSAYDITNETYNVEPLMSYYYVAARL